MLCGFNFKEALLILLLVCFYMISCRHEHTFYDNYKAFKITVREPERLVALDRPLTDNEKLRLKKVLEIDGIIYKDTLGSLYISNKAFYDDPKLLFWHYTDYIVDTLLYNKTIERLNSLK